MPIAPCKRTKECLSCPIITRGFNSEELVMQRKIPKKKKKKKALATILIFTWIFTYGKMFLLLKRYWMPLLLSKSFYRRLKLDQKMQFLIFKNY